MQRSKMYLMSRRVRQKPWAAHATSVLLAAAALAIRLAVGNAFLGFPFITFIPAVLTAAYVSGTRPGLLCALLSAAMAWYFLLAPANSFELDWPSGPIAIVVFLFNAWLIVVVVSGMNKAYQRISEAEEDRARLNAELEIRINDRTRELVVANKALRLEADARQAAEANAAQLDRLDAIGRLTGGVAHDFNNMLAVIIGNLELTQLKLGRGNADVLRHVDGAMDGAQRSASLTRRLLAFARRQPLEPVITDINKLIEGVRELLARTLGERIAIEFHLAEALWLTRVDPGQLEAALVNLAVNARDAMPGGGCLTVRTENVRYPANPDIGPQDIAIGEHVVVSVTDTGTGMSEEVQARAFEPFFTTKAPGKGTGLGLSQLYGFAKQSSGGAHIRSRLGEGTTISLSFPRAEAAPLLPDETVLQAEEAMPHASARETILVVEDEERVRSATVESLQELGYTVWDASDGASALEKLNMGSPVQLMLTDVVMPGMNGRELADVVSRQFPAVRIMFMSGYSPNGIIHDGEVDAGVDLLSKPFSRDKLARRVREMLDKPMRN